MSSVRVQRREKTSQIESDKEKVKIKKGLEAKDGKKVRKRGLKKAGESEGFFDELVWNESRVLQRPVKTNRTEAFIYTLLLN